jgi:hypothetical protein
VHKEAATVRGILFLKIISPGDGGIERRNDHTKQKMRLRPADVPIAGEAVYLLVIPIGCTAGRLLAAKVSKSSHGGKIAIVLRQQAHDIGGVLPVEVAHWLIDQKACLSASDIPIIRAALVYKKPPAPPLQRAHTGDHATTGCRTEPSCTRRTRRRELERGSHPRGAEPWR